MLVYHIFAFALIGIVGINFISFIINGLRSEAINIANLKIIISNVRKRLRKSFFNIMFLLISFIFKPVAIISFLLSEFISLVWYIAKRMCKFIKQFMTVKSRRELIYVILTEQIIAVLLMTIYIFNNPESITKNITVFNLIITVVWIGAFLLLLGVLIAQMSKRIFKKEFIISLYCLIIIIIIIIVLVFPTLGLFESYKNSGINSISECIVPLAISIYVVILLLIVLKNILDRGSMLVSATFGVVTYILTLFFITCAIGFYLTAKYPQYFKKDEIAVNYKNGSNVVSYMTSYSYRGAKYLMSFPEEEDFIIILEGREIRQVPMDVFIIYFLGLLINIIITAYFVSYAVSIYLMRKTQEDQYNEFMERKDFLDKYKDYVVEKFKDSREITQGGDANCSNKASTNN